MALSVDYVYQFALKLIKKNMAGGLGSIDFQYQWNDAQSSYMDDLLGRFQARNNGKTGANTGLLENETILQKLSPFTKPVDLTITSGNATKPDDFIYRLALRINGVDAFKINQSQIATVNGSAIDAPSIANNQFYFVEYEGYYYLLPHTLPGSGITTAQLDYICEPTMVVWGFVIDGSGRQVYEPTTSVQPEWDSNSCLEITKRMLANLGVAFKDADFANFGKATQVTGE